MTRPLIIVAAVADNGVIGRDNQLLWRLKTDLRRFRELTWGKPMIMGRKTFESIGRPLPGRETIVLTRDPGFSAEGVHVAQELGRGGGDGQTSWPSGWGRTRSSSRAAPRSTGSRCRRRPGST